MSLQKGTKKGSKGKNTAHLQNEGFIKELWLSFPGGIFQLELNNDNILANIVNDKILDILGCSQIEYEHKYECDLTHVFGIRFVNRVKKAIKNGTYDIENHEEVLTTYTGNKKWVAVSLSHYCVGDNEDHIFMYVMNLDKDKNKHNMLMNENATFRNLLNNDSDIMFEYDIEADTISLNMVSENGTLTEKKMYKFRELIHNSGFIHDNDKDKFLKMVWLDDTTTEEFRLQSLDGTYIWCSVKAIALKNDDYINKKIIGWIKNIDSRKKNSEYLEDLEKRDGLTKLYSEDYAQGVISDYLRSGENNKVSALVIIDIDNFHEVNEKVGVVFGDAVLINVASEIKKVVRSDDIIARIGGDKFMIFLKNVEGKEHVIACVKRIQELISGISLGDSIPFGMTCSIGIALSSQANSKTYEELLRNTDSALYYAKINGQNRYEVYNKKNMTKLKNNSLYNVYGESIKNHENNENLENELTTEVLSIMSRTKDIKVGIKKILDVIGHKFGATQVNIAQFQSKRFCITHNWSYNGITHDDEIITLKIDKSLKEKYLGFFNEDNILKIEDIESLSDLDQAKWLIEKYGIRSCIQVALKDDSELVAVLSVIDCQCNRVWESSHINALKEVSKILTNYLLQLKESVNMENKINEMKNYDMLTGLPLKNNFKSSIRKIIKNNPEKKYVIINLDFVKFKMINDSFGYDRGDRILKEVARLIARNQYGIIEGCRSFSDNFLMIQEFTCKEHTEILIEQMYEDFSLRLKKKYPGIKLGFSVGACIIEDNYGDIMGPIDNSGLARKYAKENNKMIHFFDDEMKKKIQMEFEILNSMENALHHSEFKVYYQPKVNIADGTIAGAEALVRSH